jgi:pyruvate dehydrogenase E1 component alpha subunit
MHGHGAHDDASYVPAEQLELWAARDPIERQRERLRGLGADVDAVAAAARAEVDAATAEALAMPAADPASVLSGVFCEGEPRPLGSGAAPWSGFAGA